MNNEIELKVERFVELSKIFSDKEGDIFTDLEIKGDSINNSYITLNNGLGLNNNTYYSSPTSVPENVVKTKSENILKAAKERAEMADNFDEYKKLQKYLSEYFQSLKNLKTK